MYQQVDTPYVTLENAGMACDQTIVDINKGRRYKRDFLISNLFLVYSPAIFVNENELY